jgi:hypothetical protein
MTSPVDVCNIALAEIGAKAEVSQISPPDGSQASIICARLYQPKIDALSRAAHWNCLRAQDALNVVMARRGTPENPNGTTILEPPWPWLYSYGYPTDCLAARFILPKPPQATPTGVPIFNIGTFFYGNNVCEGGHKFAVGTALDQDGNRIRIILTDLEYAQLVYTIRVTNCDLWDPHYLAAATSTMGAWLVNPTNRNADLAKQQYAVASAIVAEARVSDGNEGFTSSEHLPDWMAVRGPGSGFGAGVDFEGYFQNWSSLALPGGPLI